MDEGGDSYCSGSVKGEARHVVDKYRYRLESRAKVWHSKIASCQNIQDKDELCVYPISTYA